LVRAADAAPEVHFVGWHREEDVAVIPLRVQSRWDGRGAFLRGATGDEITAGVDGREVLRARDARGRLGLQHARGSDLDVPTVGQRLGNVGGQLRILERLPPAK